MPPGLVRITGEQLEMNTLNRLGSNYGTASLGSCAIHHERPGCSSGFPLTMWVWLLWSQLFNYLMSYPYKYSSTTYVDIPELHNYEKS